MIKIPAYILVGLIVFLIITGLIGVVLTIREIIDYFILKKKDEEEK